MRLPLYSCFLGYLFFLGVMSEQLLAQNTPQIDSLLQLLENTTTDTAKVNLLNQISKNYIPINPEQAQEYAIKSLTLAKKINFSKGIAEAYLHQGIYSNIKNNYEESLKMLYQAKTIATKINHLPIIASCYNNFGLIHFKKAEYDKAIDFYDKSLKINYQIQDSLSIAHNYSNLGVVYKNKGDILRALEFHQKALKINSALRNKTGIATAYNNIGVLYRMQGEYQKALDYYEKSLPIKIEIGNQKAIANTYGNMGNIYRITENYQKALDYYEKALAISQKIEDNIGIIDVKSDMGMTYRLQQEQPKSLAYFQEAFALAERVNYKQGIIKNAINIGITYQAQGKYSEALTYYQKGYVLAQEVGLKELEKSAASNLSEIYASLGDFKQAYNFHKAFKAIEDSLLNENNVRKITSLEYEYRYEQERKIKEAERLKEMVLQEAKFEQQRWQKIAFGIGAMMLFLLAIYFYYNNLQKQKTNKILKKQKEEITAQAEELQNNNEMLQKLHDFKEQFSQMLVHDLKNPLTTVIGLSALPYVPKENQERIHQAAQQVLFMVGNMLDIYKFEEAEVQLYIDKVHINKIIEEAFLNVLFLATQKNITLHKNIREQYWVNADESLTVRILTNLLNNAIKYTPNNGNIHLEAFQQSDDFLTISVQDDGIGIAKDKQAKIFDKFAQIEARNLGQARSTGLGLTFAKMAVEAQNGDIGLVSEEGKGATFWFTLPLQQVENQVITTEESVSSDIIWHFSEEEKHYLKDFIPQLAKLEIYRVSEILKILNQIETQYQNLQRWKMQLQNSVFYANEQQYQNLLKNIG